MTPSLLVIGVPACGYRNNEKTNLNDMKIKLYPEDYILSTLAVAEDDCLLNELLYNLLHEQNKGPRPMYKSSNEIITSYFTRKKKREENPVSVEFQVFNFTNKI